MSVGPIVPKIVDTYNVNEIVPQLCALSFFIMFVPVNFLSLSVLERSGFKPCIQVGGTILIVGAWVRMLVITNDSFYFVLGGQIIAALS